MIEKNIKICMNETVINDLNQIQIQIQNKSQNKNKIVVNETFLKKDGNITKPIKRVIDNDCALIPIQHQSNKYMIQKEKSPIFKDWSREIGI